jgi:hypothetical protein
MTFLDLSFANRPCWRRWRSWTGAVSAISKNDELVGIISIRDAVRAKIELHEHEADSLRS